MKAGNSIDIGAKVTIGAGSSEQEAGGYLELSSGAGVGSGNVVIHTPNVDSGTILLQTGSSSAPDSGSSGSINLQIGSSTDSYAGDISVQTEFSEVASGGHVQLFGGDGVVGGISGKGKEKS